MIWAPFSTPMAMLARVPSRRSGMASAVQNLSDKAFPRCSQEDGFPKDSEFGEVLQDEQVMFHRFPKADPRVDDDLIRIDPGRFSPLNGLS